MAASFSGGDRLAIESMRAESDGSRFTATGELSSVSKWTGKFAVDAETLDLDGLMAFLAAATPASAPRSTKRYGSTAPPPPGAPLSIEIALRSREGRALGIALSDLSATAHVRGSDALLEDLRVGLFGGRYAGSAAFRGAQAPGRYEWKGSFENLDVPRLAEFAGAPGSMTGRLAGTIGLSAAGDDPAEAIRDARGTSRVAITDGRISGLEIVRNVILAFGKPAGERPAGSGEAFTRLAATMAIDGPGLTTKDLTFESRDFDMTGEGTLSLATQAMRFRTNVILSRELSAQAGRDLYRLAREGERIVLPATIDGTIGAPSVFIDVQAALGRALRNKAQDELKGLFERFRKRIGR
jgi:AsmA protein